MDTEFEDQLVELSEWRNEHYYGIYRATVESVEEGDNLGVISVKIPDVFGPTHTVSRVRPCSPFAGDKHGFVAIPEPGDGVWIHLMGDPTKSPMFRDAIDVVRPDGPTIDPNNLFQQVDGWAEALLLHPSTDWLESFWAHDVPVQPAAPLGAIFGDEQARANGYVVEVDHPELGTIAMAGSPVTVTPPTRVRAFAPALGAHTEVLAEWQPREPRTPTGPAPQHPLDGVQVVGRSAMSGKHVAY